MKKTSGLFTLALIANSLHAQESDLAKKLANPVADLISAPIQSNVDFNVGPGDGTISRTNVQPVIPIGINDEWNVISRTILPIIDQEGTGDNDRPGVNATFIQPFVSYITATKTTFTLNSESTYDWRGNEWNAPLNFVVSQLLKIGDQPVQIFAGARYYVETPDGGPDLGLRFGLTFLFPKS